MQMRAQHVKRNVLWASSRLLLYVLCLDVRERAPFVILLASARLGCVLTYAARHRDTLAAIQLPHLKRERERIQ